MRHVGVPSVGGGLTDGGEYGGYLTGELLGDSCADFVWATGLPWVFRRFSRAVIDDNHTTWSSPARSFLTLSFVMFKCQHIAVLTYDQEMNMVTISGIKTSSNRPIQNKTRYFTLSS